MGDGAREDQPDPPRRRAGWLRIGAFFLLGGVFIAIGHYEIAPLCAAVGIVVWWVDRGGGTKRSDGPGPRDG